MIDHNARLKAFVKLGTFFQEFCEFANNNANSSENDISKKEDFSQIVSSAKNYNGWFTKENVLLSIKSWGDLLTEKNLNTWLKDYNLSSNKKKTVALILAGNIPLVGFHDFLTVLITGNKAIIKLSSNDKIMFPFIAKYLTYVEPTLQEDIVFTEGKLENFDAVIATGSNNTARYFEHYFSKGPNIIRKNRNSVAILTGNETTEQLEALGDDIFMYYGLGCRSVSKLFVPKGYNFDTFYKSIYKNHPIINQNKYANNYDYNKAVYLMSEFKILDNGFLMLKEDSNYGSPIATLFYEEYNTVEELKSKLETDKEKLQCVVAHNFSDNEIIFGETQKPQLWEYADHIDTVSFLITI
ncbi:acyl-CoA reductase [uncultured Maribacter sp.]|uniref:acyl-CoA reductase n=1 Tax=uncultured Maribacter sp. TaxID=431308 RepID=UPI0026018D85|nr:acyl-CoA reductase [uncultured Maribacter sp.]